MINEGSRRVELPRNINTGSKTCVIVYRNNESDIVYHTCGLIICFASVEPIERKLSGKTCVEDRISASVVVKKNVTIEIIMLFECWTWLRVLLTVESGSVSQPLTVRLLVMFALQ